MNLMVLPLWVWILFYVMVLLMLVADLKMFGSQHEVKVGEAQSGMIAPSVGEMCGQKHVRFRSISFRFHPCSVIENFVTLYPKSLINPLIQTKNGRKEIN